jgi:hypothetical protein
MALVAKRPRMSLAANFGCGISQIRVRATDR